MAIKQEGGRFSHKHNEKILRNENLKEMFYIIFFLEHILSLSLAQLQTSGYKIRLL